MVRGDVRPLDDSDRDEKANEVSRGQTRGPGTFAIQQRLHFPDPLEVRCSHVTNSWPVKYKHMSCLLFKTIPLQGLRSVELFFSPSHSSEI